jgi:hypothetical protein
MSEAYLMRTSLSATSAQQKGDKTQKERRLIGVKIRS